MSFFTKLFGEESVKENTSNINKNLKNNSTILNNKLTNKERTNYTIAKSSAGFGASITSVDPQKLRNLESIYGASKAESIAANRSAKEAALKYQSSLKAKQIADEAAAKAAANAKSARNTYKTSAQKAADLKLKTAHNNLKQAASASKSANEFLERIKLNPSDPSIFKNMNTNYKSPVQSELTKRGITSKRTRSSKITPSSSSPIGSTGDMGRNLNILEALIESTMESLNEARNIKINPTEMIRNYMAPRKKAAYRGQVNVSQLEALKDELAKLEELAESIKAEYATVPQNKQRRIILTKIQRRIDSIEEIEDEIKMSLANGRKDLPGDLLMKMRHLLEKDELSKIYANAKTRGVTIQGAQYQNAVIGEKKKLIIKRYENEHKDYLKKYEDDHKPFISSIAALSSIEQQYKMYVTGTGRYIEKRLEDLKTEIPFQVNNDPAIVQSTNVATYQVDALQTIIRNIDRANRYFNELRSIKSRYVVPPGGANPGGAYTPPEEGDHQQVAQLVQQYII